MKPVLNNRKNTNFTSTSRLLGKGGESTIRRFSWTEVSLLGLNLGTLNPNIEWRNMFD